MVNRIAPPTRTADPQLKLRDEEAGKLLVELRKKHNQTQTELAINAGVSKPKLCEWEKGKRSISLKKLGDLASALNISPHDEDSRRLVFARVPALNPKWLARKEESEKGKLLLDGMFSLCCIDHQLLDRQEWAGVYTPHWFTGTAPIPKKHIPAIIRMLTDAISDNRPAEFTEISAAQLSLARHYINPSSLEALAEQIKRSNESIKDSASKQHGFVHYLEGEGHDTGGLTR